MSLSSFCVVSNALRLNLFKLHSNAKDKKIESVEIHDVAEAMRPVEVPEEMVQGPVIFKTLAIEGMMCGHCEKMVKKALEKLPQIDEAATDWNAGTAVVSMNAEISEEELRAVIEKAGYEYLGVKAEG